MFGYAKSKAELEQMKRDYLENLKVEIENANIIETRKQKPYDAPPIPPQYKTEKDIKDDIMGLMSDLASTIINEFGFGYSKAIEVVNNFGADDLIKLIALFPTFKNEIGKDINKKKFSQIDADFLILKLKNFLKKTKTTFGLEKAFGKVDNIDDLAKYLLPSRNDMENLKNTIKNSDKEINGKEEAIKLIDNYINSYPSIEDYKKLSQLNLFERTELALELNRIMEDYNMLTKKDVEEIINKLNDNTDDEIGYALLSRLGAVNNNVLNSFKKKWNEKLIPISKKPLKLGEEIKNNIPSGSRLVAENIDKKVEDFGNILVDAIELEDEVEGSRQKRNLKNIQIDIEKVKEKFKNNPTEKNKNDLISTMEEGVSMVDNEVIQEELSSVVNDIVSSETVRKVEEEKDEVQDEDDNENIKELQIISEPNIVEEATGSIEELLDNPTPTENIIMGMEEIPTQQPEQETIEKEEEQWITFTPLGERKIDGVITTGEYNDFVRINQDSINKLENRLRELAFFENYSASKGPTNLKKKELLYSIYNGVLAAMINKGFNIEKYLIYYNEELEEFESAKNKTEIFGDAWVKLMLKIINIYRIKSGILYNMEKQELFNPVIDLDKQPINKNNILIEGFGSKATLLRQEPLGPSVKSKKQQHQSLKGRISVKKLIGKGIEVEQEPSYRKFGKYVIHYPHLVSRNVLNIKYPSLGQVPNIKQKTISDDYKSLIMDIFEGGKLNHRLFNVLDDDEKEHFHCVCKGAGLLEYFKLKRGDTDKEKDDIDRFNVLRGSFVAGNNSESVIRELRALIYKFIQEKRVTKNEGLGMLMELN